MNRSSKSSSKSPKVKQSYAKHYQYTQLAECDIGSNQSYNFYAVILDCSFPHKSYKSDRFVCSMKITDPSMKVNQEGVVETCTITFFSKKFEDLPIS